MGDEFKWILILLAVFVVLPMLGLSFGEFQRQNCRVELAKLGKPVEEIQQLCGK